MGEKFEKDKEDDEDEDEEELNRSRIMGVWEVNVYVSQIVLTLIVVIDIGSSFGSRGRRCWPSPCHCRCDGDSSCILLSVACGRGRQWQCFRGWRRPSHPPSNAGWSGDYIGGRGARDGKWDRHPSPFFLSVWCCEGCT